MGQGLVAGQSLVDGAGHATPVPTGQIVVIQLLLILPPLYPQWEGQTGFCQYPAQSTGQGSILPQFLVSVVPCAGKVHVPPWAASLVLVKVLD